MKRKCNYPNCRKKADVIEPFNTMGASDAYCEDHWKKRENRYANQQEREHG